MATDGPFRTREDLIVSALGRLGVAFTNQPPEIEDVAFVDAEIESIFRQLEGMEVVFVPDRGRSGPQGGNIPAAFFLSLSDIVADICKTKYGLPADDAAKLNAAGMGTPPGSGVACMTLKKIARGRYTGETLGALYF